MAEILCIVGARPNFMKMAPILEAMRAHPGLTPLLVHTGQHYDEAMSRVFFTELGLPTPDRNLEVGSDTHARQTARIMEAFDALLDERRGARLVLVVGDVNSTMACALVAVKRGVKVAHVEAGLRSRDRDMPEEINRLVTDAVSDLLFATSADAVVNLRAEGIAAEAIHLVGNPMIDTLRRHLEAARARRAPEAQGLPRKEYAVVTLHRPSNVDDGEGLRRIWEALREVASRVTVFFPVHPRTRARLETLRVAEHPKIRLSAPLGYLDFLGLMDEARFLLTDSGGIQEETTALGVPCLTLRANTERPVTITEGTNRLLGADPASIAPAVRELLDAPPMPPRCPALWDGKAGERIAGVLSKYMAGR